MNPDAARRDPARIEKRRARVMELREEGLTFREIADTLGVSASLIHKDFEACLRNVVEPAVESYRASQVARLAKMREIAQDVIDRRHLVVSASGRVAVDLDGEPIEDDSIVLSAIDRLVKIDEAERKLLGLDVKPEVEITGNLTYQILGMGDSEA